MIQTIKVGSKNKVKVGAVKEIIPKYVFLSNAKVKSVECNGPIRQPKSLNEIIQCAMYRAKECFKDCDLSFGIEGGLMKIPETKTNFMNISCCVIYDGNKFHMGFSPAFEYPAEVIKLVFEEGIDINQAVRKIGLTKKKKIGSHGGTIGILTNGRVTRKEIIELSIMMALIHLENPQLYDC